MNSYHFSLGSTERNRIGFVARIRAESEEAACAILNRILPETVVVYKNLYDGDGNGIEYLHVYFGDRPITPDDQGEEAEAVEPGDYEIGETPIMGIDWPWEIDRA